MLGVMGVSADMTFERPRKARQQRPAGAASAMGSGLHDAKAPPQMQRWRGSPSRTPLASGGIKGGGEYGITSLAQRQLAEKLKIPFACFERMRAGHPDLLDRNVNTWLHTEGDRRMIRTLDGQVRAVLSDRYRRLDDFDLAESVLPILQRPEGARFESVELTDTKMYLKVITPGVEFEVAPGDIVQSGIVITNSEVGCGTLSVQPLLYRLVCKNGLIASDRLRLALGDPSADDYALFSADERAELLFRALYHLCVGGGLCQYEDRIDGLLDSAKAVYRDLVRVHKDGATGQLAVSSWTYRIDALDSAAGGAPLWPRDSPYNFCYASVDPVRRRVTVWSNAFLPML
jgi:hypothetical protein